MKVYRRADEGKGLAFIDVVEGRFTSDGGTEGCNVDFVGEIWKGPLLKGGNYTYDRKNEWKTIENDANADDRTLVGFGRYFIANPDLPARIQKGNELNDYDRSTFYNTDDYGYNTYPFYGEENKADPNIKVLGVALA